MNRLEAVTKAYWLASYGLRHPDAPPIATGTALKALCSSDRLRPEEWKLAELMHVVRYDIIEGNTQWRGNQKVRGLASILPMRR